MSGSNTAVTIIDRSDSGTDSSKLAGSGILLSNASVYVSLRSWDSTILGIYALYYAIGNDRASAIFSSSRENGGPVGVEKSSSRLEDHYIETTTSIPSRIYDSALNTSTGKL